MKKNNSTLLRGMEVGVAERAKPKIYVIGEV